MRYKHKKLLMRFWHENYLNVNVPYGLCGLCANTGIIDTTETAISPKGIKSGGKYFCVCPNGRVMHEVEKKKKN